MGRSKHEQYSQQELNAARIGRAIGAPARVVILHEINEHQMLTNKYLNERLSLSGSAVYQHLQILKETGFIESKYLGDDSGYLFTRQGEDEYSKIQNIL